MPRRTRRSSSISWRALFTALLLNAGCAGSRTAVEPPPPPAVATVDTTAADTTAAADTAKVNVPTIPTTVPIAVAAPTAGVTDTSGTTPGRFDLGKMWTFDYPPVDYFRQAYDIDADTAWFNHARLGALRFATYCSASFVSPNGLVMTNHHCGRESIVQVTQPGEHLIEDGFYSHSVEEERPVPGLFVDQLVGIQDVTEEVLQALQGLTTDAERAQARERVIQEITDRMTQAAGGASADVSVQVVSFYNDSKYSAYTFHRYDDVRLVMAPEEQIAFFGGDLDNFTYPRYDLDMSWFRVYGPDGKPLSTPNYFHWSESGAKAGDPVFVVGNPGSTDRLVTVAQLAFFRDVQQPAILNYVESAEQVFRDYNAQHPSDEIGTEVFSLANAEKVYTGHVKALNDAQIMARRRAEEQQFIQAIGDSAQLASQYGELIDQIAAIEQERARYGPEYTAFIGLNPRSSYSSATLRRAILVAGFLAQHQGDGAPPDLSSLRQQLEQVTDQPRELDQGLLAARLRTFQQAFRPNSQVVQQILQGRSPEEEAQRIVGSTALTDTDEIIDALQQGSLSATSDEALRVANAFMPRLQSYQRAIADLNDQEDELLSKYGRARFAVYGTDIPPDATFSLRIADGVVQGYPYNGTVAPPHTTFNGVLGRYYAYHNYADDWELPERWLNLPASFNLNTPLDLVSTNDIIGGNSGSPLLNQDLEVVGLVFDGNIESLSGAYIYLPEIQRSVSVDSRGILEALDDAYDMDRIVLELTTGRLVDTESEADRVESATH